MKAEKGVLLQSIPRGYIMEMGSGYDGTISYAEVVSVSASCSRCSSLALSSLFPHVYDLLYFMDYMLFPHELLVYIV